MVIIVLLLYTAFYVPYKVCFQDETSDAQFIFDLFVDFCFLSDIIVNFLTAYEGSNGLLISDKAMIANNYLRTWFFLDLFTSIPF